MKAYILQLGYIKTLSAILVNDDTPSSVEVSEEAIKSLPMNLVDIPVWAVLIETEEHKILFDLGCIPDAMEGGWPEMMQQYMPIFRKPEEYIEKQLALVGLTPQDIDTVVLSHLHADHFGAIEQFTHCDVYLPKEDWVHALIVNHENNNPDNGMSYLKRCVEAPVKQYHPVAIGEDFELFPGIEIITLPGHAANLLGLVLHLSEDGTVIFPSDAVSCSLNYGPPVRHGPSVDPAVFEASIEKVRALAEKYNAKVMISHDMEMYAEYRKAPEFYS